MQRQADDSLAEVRAAAEAEMERSATLKHAVMEERDRSLEQASPLVYFVVRLNHALSVLCFCVSVSVSVCVFARRYTPKCLADFLFVFFLHK